MTAINSIKQMDHVDSKWAPEYRIYADHQVTRRQRLHFVVDRENVLSFTANDIGQCIQHVIDKGHSKMILAGRTYAVVIDVSEATELK